MTYWRITSPRSRTDRAAEVLHRALRREHRLPDGRMLGGLSSEDSTLVDCVRLRVRRIRTETRDRIDQTLQAAGYAPLRWTEDRRAP